MIIIGIQVQKRNSVINNNNNNDDDDDDDGDGDDDDDDDNNNKMYLYINIETNQNPRPTGRGPVVPVGRVVSSVHEGGQRLVLERHTRSVSHQEGSQWNFT